MSEPLVLVILLGSGAEPTTEGLMAAARRALGPETTVLADTSDATSDADALAIGERVHARAVARVSWSDGASKVAHLHVHVAPSSEWADDAITFLPQDAASEKGRTVGYALASMVQRLERERADEAEAQPAVPRTTAPPPAPPLSPSLDATTEVYPRAQAPAASPSLDLFVHGSGALGGGATAAGGAVGMRWWPVTRIGLRAAAGARAGTIPEADASTTTLFTAAGPGYRVAVGRSLELGARADLVLLRHTVVRSRVVETTRARWLGAVDLVIEADWALGPRAGLLVGLGTEVAFGTTDVDVGGVRVADIPPIRAIAELGARIRF